MTAVVLPRATAVILEVIEAGDVEVLAQFHLDLTAEIRQLQDLARSVEQRLAEVMPDKLLELPGLPVMERRTGNVRKAWDSEALLARVVQLSVDPDGTGALPEPAEVLDRVVGGVRKCLPITPSVGWRVTGLRDLGLDPDEWCESKPGRVTVQIHGEVTDG